MTLTIEHTEAEGTLLLGTSRGDGSAEVVKALGWRWGRSIGLWFVPRSRDAAPKRPLIEQTARQTIGTDERWRAAIGPILTSEIYDGESYDARLEKSGWMQPGYDDSAWAGVRLIERSLATLVAPSGPPVRRIEEVAPPSELFGAAHSAGVRRFLSRVMRY